MIPDLLQHGLSKVIANGILGDGRPGDATRGKRCLEVWLDLILREADARTAVAMPQKQRSVAIHQHEPIG
jgi:hypothetical protein